MIDLKLLIFPAGATVLALILYLVTIINVGRSRAKYNVPAPQISGNDDFERILRVQQNTLEQLPLFLPALWLFSLLVSPIWGTGLAAVWLIGRTVYMWGYYQAAEKRGPGFGISFLTTLVLLLGSLVGIVRLMLKA